MLISFSAQKKYLIIPIEESASESNITVINSEHRYVFQVRIAVSKIDYYVPLELGPGETKLEIHNAPKATAVAWGKLELSDTFDASNTDKYRPVYHFTPPYGWMNDPNGLFYLDGVYHVYYQYNPYANIWGNMHWGHATTKDFVHWEHQPVAVFPDELGHAFSGSIIVDKENDAGFGKNAVLAFYTSAIIPDAVNHQHQSLAISTDGGYTFKKYENNPIIVCPDIVDFRDPKVIRYGDKWNVIISSHDEVRIFSSKNLVDWTFESGFGHGCGGHAGVWECPDLVPIGDKWVLILNINPGGRFGGSATQYFIGQFDGHEFKIDSKRETTKWMDFGKDLYATVTFHNAPKLIGFGWMSNWEYAQKVPCTQFRSAMSIPRELTLKHCQCTNEDYLISLPLKEFVDQFNKPLDKIAQACFVDLEIAGVTAQQVLITLKNDYQEEVTMMIDRTEGGVFRFERGIKSGITSFGETFVGQVFAYCGNKENYHFQLFLDTHSCEVFDMDKEFCITETYFPRHPYTDIVVTPVEGKAEVKNLTIKGL